MDPGTLLTGLKLIANILRSQFLKHLAPHLLHEQTFDAIIPQLEQIKSSINDLEMKDHKVATTLFEDTLNSLKVKFQLFSTSSAVDLKQHSDRIEAELVRAQERAVTASHSGLKTKEKIDRYKCILATEMLRVLNEASCKAKLESTDTTWMKRITFLAHEKCNKYLKEWNEIDKIKDYITSKVPVEGYEKRFLLFRTDRWNEVCQLLTANMSVGEFFHKLEVTHGATSLPVPEVDTSEASESPVSMVTGFASPEKHMEGKPQLLGLDPMEVLLRLLDHAGINQGMKVPLDTPKERFEYAREAIPMLSLCSGRNPKGLKEAGWRDIAKMKNGGRADANTEFINEEANRRHYVSRMFSKNGSWCSEDFWNTPIELRRHLNTLAIPKVLAIQAGNHFDAYYGPKDFHFYIFKNGIYKPALQVEDLSWKPKKDEWKFWILSEPKELNSFKLEISPIESKQIEIRRLQLFVGPEKKE